MNMMFKAFFKKLFGAKYERLTRAPFLYLIVYLGLDLADFHITVAPFILYLIVTTSTAAVMWQALSSQENAAAIQNMWMLPFEKKPFLVSYTAALGIYTFLTKTAAVLAVLLAVSDWKIAEVLGSIVCAFHAVAVTAAVFAWRNIWHAVCVWMAVLFSAVFFFADLPWFLPMIAADSAFAVFLLLKADDYCFYQPKSSQKKLRKPHRHFTMLFYFFRYLKTHKNYLANTLMMWCIACVLPLFFRQTQTLFAVFAGFAVLSLNTPVCILLSCDPALEQAVRFLPNQNKLFFAPYGCFLFFSSLIADMIFLCSLQIQFGGVRMPLAAAAVGFALLSALCSVLLERFCPVRGWKIESDLWHHPRKYIVPAVMLLFAGAVCSFLSQIHTIH